MAKMRLLRGESAHQFITDPTTHEELLVCFTHFCYLPGHCRHLKILPVINFKYGIGRAEEKGLGSEPAQDLTMAVPVLEPRYQSVNE